MPIYEYECNKCTKIFETITFAGDRDDNPKCPHCDTDDVKKIMSAGAIRPDGIPKGKGGFAPPACGSGCGSAGGG